MFGFIKKYAKAIVAAIGYAASIATALGLTHYHWVSVILGVLSTIAVILTKNTAVRDKQISTITPKPHDWGSLHASPDAPPAGK